MAENFTTAKDLLEVIENLNLHTMKARESERLHAACKGIMIDVEEFWARWDDPK